MLEKIREIITEQLGIDAQDVVPEAKFKDDLEADSLDLFELVMALEDEYGIEIPSDDLENMQTVGDVMDYLRDKGIED